VMVAIHWPILAVLLVIGAMVWAVLAADAIRLPRFKTDP